MPNYPDSHSWTYYVSNLECALNDPYQVYGYHFLDTAVGAICECKSTIPGLLGFSVYKIQLYSHKSQTTNEKRV